MILARFTEFAKIASAIIILPPISTAKRREYPGRPLRLSCNRWRGLYLPWHILGGRWILRRAWARDPVAWGLQNHTRDRCATFALGRLGHCRERSRGSARACPPHRGSERKRSSSVLPTR